MTKLARMSIQEMGETAMISRQVHMWSMGGDMRAISGSDPMPPASPLERASIMAMDAVLQVEPNQGRGSSNEHGLHVRDDMLELMTTALRLAVVDERLNGADGRSDVDRTRLVLVSMATVQALRERSDGLEPAELENSVLESMRRKSGIEVGAFDRDDAHAGGVGMGDMVKGEEASRQMAAALKGAMTPSSDAGLEERIAMLDATWPQVQIRQEVTRGVAARSPDSSMPAAALRREAADRAIRAAGR